MIKLFLDASVLFAAAYSSSGASRELFRLAARDAVTLVISRFVLEEAERNLSAKAATEIVQRLHLLLAVVSVEISPDPSKEEVLAAAAYTALKDAPVVAAARQAGVDYLVSLDRKHLVEPPEVAEQSGLAIVLPETALNAVREHLA